MEARKLSASLVPPFQLSLRIRHPSIDPLEISRTLQLEAEHSFKAGAPRASGGGSVHSESYWLAVLDPLSWQTDLLPMDAPATMKVDPRAGNDRMRSIIAGSLGLSLSLFVRRFLGPHLAFLQRIQTEGGQIALLVEIEPDEVKSFMLTPEAMRALDKLGVTLEFEFGA